MAYSYAKSIPRDQGGQPLDGLPAPVKAVAQFYRDNGQTSSIQSLTDNTTQIEVGSNGTQGVYIRWIPSTEGAAAPAGSVLTTNFDHFVPPNTYRTFVVPKESQGVNSVVGANIQNGLYRRVAIGHVAGAGVGSILTTEY